MVAEADNKLIVNQAGSVQLVVDNKEAEIHFADNLSVVGNIVDLVEDLEADNRVVGTDYFLAGNIEFVEQTNMDVILVMADNIDSVEKMYTVD